MTLVVLQRVVLDELVSERSLKFRIQFFGHAIAMALVTIVGMELASEGKLWPSLFAISTIAGWSFFFSIYLSGLKTVPCIVIAGIVGTSLISISLLFTFFCSLPPIY